MAFENFIVETEGRVAICTINRPPMNTLSVGTVREMEKILDQFENDGNIGAIIITGSGDKAFCAGADITEFGSFSGGPKEAMMFAHRVFMRMERYPKPIIACLNGYALGGGNELHMACHLSVAADTATIGLPEVKLGIIPGYGGTQRLPRIVGRRRALEILLTGERISAAEAQAMGLVNRVVPKGQELQAAKDLAHQLAKGAPIAQAMIIDAVDRGLELPLEQALEIEADNQLKASSTADAAEGIQAFFMKREPQFKGR
jgi:enoyl-CoA hydratase